MRFGEPKNFAKPKSPIFSTPFELTSKLLGFKSRCKIQFMCKYSRPLRVITMYALILAGVRTGIFGSLMIISRSVSQKSNTSETLDLWPNTSNKPITFSCCNSWRSLISLNAVRLIPSRASSRDPILIFLTATIASVSVSRALYTVANWKSQAQH